MSSPLGLLPACLYECLDPASPGGTVARTRGGARGAPALVLAVPGVPSAAIRSLAEEVVSIARSELPGLEAVIGFLEGDDVEFPSLANVLTAVEALRTQRYELAVAAGREVTARRARPRSSSRCSPVRTAPRRAGSARP